MNEEDIKEIERYFELCNITKMNQYWNKTFIKLYEAYKEQEKVIDEMTELIARKPGARIEICHNMNCDKRIAIECKSCAKQYFINKVKEKK